MSCKKFNELGIEQWREAVSRLNYPTDNIPPPSVYCFDKNYGYVKVYASDKYEGGCRGMRWFKTKQEAMLHY